MVNRTNHIWTRRNLQRDLSCDGEVSRLFPYFLYMVDSTKRPASVGLAPIMSIIDLAQFLVLHVKSPLHGTPHGSRLVCLAKIFLI